MEIGIRIEDDIVSCRDDGREWIVEQPFKNCDPTGRMMDVIAAENGSCALEEFDLSAVGYQRLAVISCARGADEISDAGDPEVSAGTVLDTHTDHLLSPGATCRSLTHQTALSNS